MHDLGRHVVLRRSRTYRRETRAHARVVRTRRGTDRGKLAGALHPAQRFHDPTAVLEPLEPCPQPVEQVRGEKPGVAIDRDTPVLETAGRDDLRHRIAGVRVVRVADDAGEVGVRARVVRFQPTEHQKRRALRRYREALEGVVAGGLLAAQPEDVLRPARHVEVDTRSGESALEAALSRVDFLFRERSVAAAYHAVLSSSLGHSVFSLRAFPRKLGPMSIVALRPPWRHFHTVSGCSA